MKHPLKDLGKPLGSEVYRAAGILEYSKTEGITLSEAFKYVLSNGYRPCWFNLYEEIRSDKGPDADILDIIYKQAEPVYGQCEASTAHILMREYSNLPRQEQLNILPK